MLRSKDGVEISDRRVMLVHMYPKCFVASEAVKWIQNNLSFTKEQAIFFCQLLTTREFIHHCQNRSLKFADNAEFWRFQYHEEGALNWKHVWVWDIESPPCKIVERLSENLLNLCKNAMEKDSKMDPKDDFTVITSPAQVFSSLVLTPEFENFEYSVAELQKVQLNGLDSKEKLAFWLNTYNLLSLHAIIVSLSRGENPYEGFISRKKYFSTQTYIVANMTFSLDDIEHGILRPRNNYFGEGDERAQFKIDGPDARIFSVLSCYNKSSPKTLIIKSENVDRFVDYACRRHFTSVKFQDYTMFIPKICDWYSSDYGTRDDLIKFVQSYLRHDQSMMLNTSFKTGKFSLKYLDFDWEIAFDLKDYNLDLRDPLLKNF
uniref:DEP domain-containing protein n=1 Tax=Arcella intermedia TaxID=1963864 RepID=A0A6B2L6Z3_9EUKA